MGCSLSGTDDWVSLFGKPDTPYHFGSMDVGALQARAQELEQYQGGMKKKVNPKVLNMIERFALCAGRVEFSANR